MKRKNKKLKPPSNNTKKLLILTLLASSCLDAEPNVATKALNKVLKNTLHTATTLHPQEDLNKIHKFLEDEAIAKDDKDTITHVLGFTLALLSIDRHKLKLFYGFNTFLVPEDIVITAKDVEIWVKFLDKVDTFCNTKPYVSKIELPKLKAKSKPKKEKKVRDKPSKSKNKATVSDKNKKKFAEKEAKRKLAYKQRIFKIKAKHISDINGAYFVETYTNTDDKSIISLRRIYLGMRYSIYFNKQDILTSMGWKTITKKRLAQVMELLRDIDNEIKGINNG